MMQVALEDIPALLADALGISEATAQVLLSVIVILALLLPTMYLARGRAITIQLVMIFLAECLLIGMGWLPYWLLIATIAVMAIAVALLGTRVVVGGT